MLILLLVFETIKLGNNWLDILLIMVLQVEAESICAVTIFDFPNGAAAATPRTQWRWWNRSLIFSCGFVLEIYLLLLGASGGFHELIYKSSRLKAFNDFNNFPRLILGLCGVSVSVTFTD